MNAVIKGINLSFSSYMDELNLFSMKEDYLLSHNQSGRCWSTKNLPVKQQRKMIFDNMHLMEGMTFTQTNQFPQLEAFNESLDFEAVSYHERNKHDGHGEALHFFQEDYTFRNAVWYKLEQTTSSIMKYDYCFTPDFSLWRDIPTGFYNIQNIFRTRFVGAYWQMCGIKVIPTASWGDLNSFSFCFEGLPDKSVTAVSAMGCRRSTDAFNRWCYGLRRLEEVKSPTTILIYGEEIEIPGLNTPVKFIPDFISTKLRNI